MLVYFVFYVYIDCMFVCMYVCTYVCMYIYIYNEMTSLYFSKKTWCFGDLWWLAMEAARSSWKLLSNQYDMGWWSAISHIFLRGWLNHQPPTTNQFLVISPLYLNFHFCWFPILQFFVFRWCKPWRVRRALCWRSRPMSQPGRVNIEPGNQNGWTLNSAVNHLPFGVLKYGWQGNSL